MQEIKEPNAWYTVHPKNNSYELESTTVQGRAEQDPHVWLQAVETCSTYQMVVRCGSIRGNRAAPTDGAENWHRSNTLTHSFTSLKILCMKRNEPDNFAKTKWFVLPHDFITMKLGSSSTSSSICTPVTEAGDASGNGFFDTTTRQNIPELADLLDPALTHKPLIVLPPNDIAGYLNDRYRQRLQLQPSAAGEDPSIPISVGSGDSICSALGCGCVLPGQAVMSLGTAGTLFGVSETPAPTDTPLSPFCDATGLDLPLACTISCTAILTNVLEACCPNGWTHEKVSQRLLEEQSSDVGIGIGCDGLSFLPYLGGERASNWPRSTGASMGLTPQHRQSKEHLCLLCYRACMEAITFCLADALQFFPDTAKNLDKLYVVGGGTKNPLWRQMIANIMQCPLVFPVETESAALGASFQVATAAEKIPIRGYIALQNIQMEPQLVQPCQSNYFQRYRSLGQTLFAR